MWRALTPKADDVAKLRAAREKLDLFPLAIHVSYLINLASADPIIREKSIAGFRGELERGLAIGAEFLIVHPGSYKGQTLECGIRAFVDGLQDAARGISTAGLTVLLEKHGGVRISDRVEI